MRGGVEDRWMAVGVGIALGERPGGEPVQLAQQVAQGVGVVVDVRPGRPVLHAEDLEEVELDVAQIAAEVPHRRHRLAYP